ncbi:exocyst subunit [Mycoemilia scoparia]|uniref:Exocyst complex component Sec8 n=1 Tax=Mycoemilia scoparia TaxID=417184 RepID=A0A9W8DX63_9FUNG|nr:exocyst subunit [Mycoemilia scoparia]
MSDEERKEYALQKAEYVLSQIDGKWSFIKDRKFNPVALALQMTDSSSLGLDYNVFHNYHMALNASLEDIINEYYTSFNTSILSFSGLHDRISGASSSINHTRTDLISVKQLLTEERSSVEQLYAKSKQTEEVISIINKIIEVRNIPSEVSKLSQEKKFVEAAKKLSQGLKFVSNPEFKPIKTLFVLEQKLNKEKEDLVKVIIEELHNHVYLMSPYSERKAALEDDSEDEDAGKLSKTIEVKRKAEDNPEADSYSYVGKLLECLFTINMGTETIKNIYHRIPQEISNLVDRIIVEVEDRSKAIIGQVKLFSPDSLDDTEGEILDEYFRVLLGGFESVLEYHHHIAKTIDKLVETQKEANYDGPQHNFPKYNIQNVWNSMKEEIGAMLKNYLIPSDNTNNSNGLGNEQDDEFGDSGEKPSFKLFEIDIKSTSRQTAENIYDSITAKMDQLAISNNVNNNILATNGPVLIDQYSGKKKVYTHKLLAKPKIEHSPIIFNAAIRFVDHISETFFPDEPPRATGIFLHEFFFRVYLPHVEDVSAQKFQQVITAPDTFLSDTASTGVTIFKSAVQLIPMIRNFSRLLTSLSLFKNDTFDITLDLSRKYYGCCLNLFHSILSGPNGRKYTSARWAENEDLVQLLDMIMSLTTLKGWVDFSTHAEREIKLEEELKMDRSLYSGELISDPKKLITLAILQQTLKWFMAQLRLIDADRAKKLEDGQVKVETTIIKAQRKMLDEIIDKYNALAVECLVILRIEVRVCCIYHLDLATREGDYRINQNEVETDRYIQILNSQLALYQEKIQDVLASDELNFVFGGVSILMAHMLIVNTRYIREFNMAGAQKMIRNVLSLQQNLTNISLSGESGLDKARKFYELYGRGIEGTLHHITNEGPSFTFDEYKRLFDFVYTNYAADPTYNIQNDEIPSYETAIENLKSSLGV